MIVEPTVFFVGGDPSPQGSSIAIISKSTKRPIVIPVLKGRLTQWRKLVESAAVTAHRSRLPFDCPVRVDLSFRLRAPIKQVRPVPSIRPDIDKLARAVLDALTGTVLEDDGLVVCLTATKDYASSPERVGVHVEVRPQ